MRQVSGWLECMQAMYPGAKFAHSIDDGMTE